MHLLLLGVSHRTAPVEVREQLDFSSRHVGDAVEAISARAFAAESVVVSTCNRSEIYVATEDPTRARADLEAFLCEYHGLTRDAFVPHLFVKEDAGAALHLFRVSSGLDSLVVGEPQILGQVKDAFDAAHGRRCTGPLLSKLFHWSFGVGKRVRTETAIGEGAVSISYAAVALARKIFGNLAGRRVLIVGAGEISTLTAQHLRAQGVGDITIANRTLAHAEVLAAQVSGRAVPWDSLWPALASADIVVTSTGSQRPIITKAHLEGVMRTQRGANPLFIIDIAVPRDVAPDVTEFEQVFLYNVDDLQSVVEENITRRTGEVSRAEQIVAEELARFSSWQRSRGAVPTIVALRQKFDAIRRSELNRLDHKLTGLPDDAKARVEEVTRLIVEKLLLEPTETLKGLPDEETQAAFTDAVNRLFGLRPDDSTDSTESSRRKRDTTP